MEILTTHSVCARTLRVRVEHMSAIIVLVFPNLIAESEICSLGPQYTIPHFVCKNPLYFFFLLLLHPRQCIGLVGQ